MHSKLNNKGQKFKIQPACMKKKRKHSKISKIARKHLHDLTLASYMYTDHILVHRSYK